MVLRRVHDRKAKDKEGFTAFHYTLTKAGCHHLIKTFEKKDGSLIKEKSGSGETPLWMAVENENMDAMKVLLEKCWVDVNEVHEKVKASPLWLAVNEQLHLCIEYLLERGAKIDMEPAADCLLYTSPSPRDRG